MHLGLFVFTVAFPAPQTLQSKDISRLLDFQVVG